MSFHVIVGAGPVGSATARLLAARRCPTLLLELDLEAPALDRALGVSMPPLSGFSQQVFRRLHEPGAPWNVVRPSDNLSLLLEGRIRTPGILHGGAVAAALASLASSFRVIVAHLPVIDEVVEQPVFDAVTEALILAVAREQESEASALLVQRFAKKPLADVIVGPLE